MYRFQWPILRLLALAAIAAGAIPGGASPVHVEACTNCAVGTVDDQPYLMCVSSSFGSSWCSTDFQTCYQGGDCFGEIE